MLRGLKSILPAGAGVTRLTAKAYGLQMRDCLSLIIFYLLKFIYLFQKFINPYVTMVSKALRITDHLIVVPHRCVSCVVFIM